MIVVLGGVICGYYPRKGNFGDSFRWCQSLTGEVLPEWDSCNQVEIVRALHTVLKRLESIQEKPQKPQAENAGKPWTEDDEEILCQMFDTGCTSRELCNRFGRTKGAIAARLVHLRKIGERADLK